MNPRNLTRGCSRRPGTWTLRSMRSGFPRYARPRLSHNVRRTLERHRLRGGGVSAEEALGTIAQIGVSLAGFAGIVGALAGEKLRPMHPEVWYPFWALIASGLGVVFVALFPFLLIPSAPPIRVLWQPPSPFLVGRTVCWEWV